MPRLRCLFVKLNPSRKTNKKKKRLIIIHWKTVMNSVNVKELALHKAHTMIKNKTTNQSECSIIPKQPDTFELIILASSPNLNARVSEFSRQGYLN